MITESDSDAGGGCSSYALFDLDAVAQDSPRLQQLKAHDIQTHHAPHCEETWMAIPMNEAREVAMRYDPDSEYNSIPEITASVGRVLDDEGLIFTGHTREDVETAALSFALRSNA